MPRLSRAGRRPRRTRRAGRRPRPSAPIPTAAHRCGRRRRPAPAPRPDTSSRSAATARSASSSACAAEPCSASRSTSPSSSPATWFSSWVKARCASSLRVRAAASDPASRSISAVRVSTRPRAARSSPREPGQPLTTVRIRPPQAGHAQLLGGQCALGDRPGLLRGAQPCRVLGDRADQPLLLGADAAASRARSSGSTPNRSAAGSSWRWRARSAARAAGRRESLTERATAGSTSPGPRQPTAAAVLVSSETPPRCLSRASLVLDCRPPLPQGASRPRSPPRGWRHASRSSASSRSRASRRSAWTTRRGGRPRPGARAASAGGAARR